MVWEKNVYAIVMLTKCVEQGRVSIFWEKINYCCIVYLKIHLFLKEHFPDVNTFVLRKYVLYF